MNRYQATSRCECQAALTAILDEGRHVLQGSAARLGAREIAPAHSIGAERESSFDIALALPVLRAQHAAHVPCRRPSPARVHGTGRRSAGPGHQAPGNSGDQASLKRCVKPRRAARPRAALSRRLAPSRPPARGASGPASAPGRRPHRSPRRARCTPSRVHTRGRRSSSAQAWRSSTSALRVSPLCRSLRDRMTSASTGSSTTGTARGPCSSLLLFASARREPMTTSAHVVARGPGARPTLRCAGVVAWTMVRGEAWIAPSMERGGARRDQEARVGSLPMVPNTQSQSGDETPQRAFAPVWWWIM